MPILTCNGSRRGSHHASGEETRHPLMAAGNHHEYSDQAANQSASAATALWATPAPRAGRAVSSCASWAEISLSWEDLLPWFSGQLRPASSLNIRVP